MSRPTIPPAPAWYRLRLPDDGAARFMFGPAAELPPCVLALAYFLGVMPDAEVGRDRVAWHLLVRRQRSAFADRSAWSVPVPFAVADPEYPAAELVIGSLAREVLAVAGQPARVRDLLEHDEYLAGRAVVIDARGRSFAIHRGRPVVAVVPRVPNGTIDRAAIEEPPDLAELAELVPLVEPASERAARWRERGDDS